MQGTQPFVGQGLLDDLTAQRPAGAGALAAMPTLQLPDRSVSSSLGIHDPPASTADSQQPLLKKPKVTSAMDNHPTRLENAASTAKKNKADNNNNESQNQTNQVTKRLSRSQKKKERERLVKAFAKGSPTGAQPALKQHDYSVWQVPDVAFTQDQNSTPSAGSTDSWKDLKAKAQASLKIAKTNAETKGDVSKETVASSNQTSSQSNVERKARHRRSQKANAAASSSAQTKGTADRARSDPPDTNNPQDSIATRMKLRHQREQELEALRANAKDSIGMRIRGIGRAQSDENSHVQHHAATGDYYRPSTQGRGYYGQDSRPGQDGDFYRPSYPNAVTRTTTDHYRAQSSRPRSPEKPRERQPTAINRPYPIFPLPPPNYTSNAVENESKGDMTTKRQYNGLGHGIWPVQVPADAFNSQDTASSYDIGHAFDQLQLNQSGGQLENINSASDNSSSGWAPFNQSFGRLAQNCIPPSNFQQPNNVLVPLNPNTGFSFGNSFALWAGASTGFGAPFLATPPIFTQKASTHSHATQNLEVARKKLDPKAPEFAVPSKPANVDHDSVIPSAAPQPSAAYLKQAANEPHRMKNPQPLLIISDVNGTLISRKPHNRRNFTARPALGTFLSFIMNSAQSQPRSNTGATAPTEKPYTFMIWTSARPATTQHIVSTLFNEHQLAAIAAIWSRNTLGLSAEQYYGKTQVYKRLTSVWRSTAVQATHPLYARGERWSQRNTLLLDDSAVKAASEPFNLVHVPELTPAALVREVAERDADSGVLGRVAAYIEEARWYADVSAYVKAHPFSMGGVAGEGVASPAADAGDVKDDGEASDDDEVMVMDPGAAGVSLSVEPGENADATACAKKPLDA